MLVSTESTQNATREQPKRGLVAIAFQTGTRANGGIESMTLILESLSRFRPTMVTQTESAICDRWRSNGFGVELVEMPDPPSSADLGARLETFARRIPARSLGQWFTYRLVRKTGASIVYFNDQTAFTFGALGARLAGATVVLALRGTTGLDRSRWIAASLGSDVVISLSDELESRLVSAIDARDPRRLFRRPQFVTIPSIVREPETSDESKEVVRARLGLPMKRLVIAIVGAVVPVKRHRDLVRVLGRLLPELDAELVCVGDYRPESGAYAASVEAEHRALAEPSRVRFVGFKEEVGEWYRAADIVVVGSDDEGLARCMLEALAHGVPVVSTAVCSARGVLVKTGAGRVVPVGDFEALGREVRALALDPEARARLGERGRAHVRATFDADVVGEAYDELFERLSTTRLRNSA